MFTFGIIRTIMDPLSILLERIEREYASLEDKEAEILLGLLLVPEIQMVR